MVATAEEDDRDFQATDEGSDFTGDVIRAMPIVEPQLDLHRGLPGAGHHRIGHLCYLAVVMWIADNVAHGWSVDLGSVLGVIAIPFPFDGRGGWDVNFDGEAPVP